MNKKIIKEALLWSQALIHINQELSSDDIVTLNGEQKTVGQVVDMLNEAFFALTEETK